MQAIVIVLNVSTVQRLHHCVETEGQERTRRRQLDTETRCPSATRCPPSIQALLSYLWYDNLRCIYALHQVDSAKLLCP